MLCIQLTCGKFLPTCNVNQTGGCMPKIIMHIQEQILIQAEKIIDEKGSGELTIRSVAKSCGVAVGTIYNYYSSKDALVAGVIIRRWDKSKNKIDYSIDAACSFEEGIRSIFIILNEFTLGNRNIWLETTSSKQSSDYYHKYHTKLSNELAFFISRLLNRFPKEKENMLKIGDIEKTICFIAENILLCVGNTKMDIDILINLISKKYLL